MAIDSHHYRRPPRRRRHRSDRVITVDNGTLNTEPETEPTSTFKSESEDITAHSKPISE